MRVKQQLINIQDTERAGHKDRANCSRSQGKPAAACRCEASIPFRNYKMRKRGKREKSIETILIYKLLSS